MLAETSLHYQINNELKSDKEKMPPIANYDEFEDEAISDDFDEIDGELTPLKPSGRRVPAGFYPQWPTYYPEQDNTTTGLNLYQQKKSMAQGMLDLALLSANANQLRYVLDSDERNHYYYVSLSLISTSLVLQVLVALALVFISRYNIENEEDYVYADRTNNFIMIGILLITIANVVSSAFAPIPHQK